MRIRGQGATEYLVILSVVLIIGLVSVSLLGSAFDTTSETQENAAKIYWQSGATPLRVPEIIRTNDSQFSFAMENSAGDPVTLTAVNIDGNDAAFGETSYFNNSTVYFGPGEKKVVSVDVGTGNFRCPDGQSTTVNLKLRYVTQFGNEKTEGSDGGYFISCNIVRGNTSSGGVGGNLTFSWSPATSGIWANTTNTFGGFGTPDQCCSAPYTCLAVQDPGYVFPSTLQITPQSQGCTFDVFGQNLSAGQYGALVTVTDSLGRMGQYEIRVTAENHQRAAGQTCSQNSDCASGNCASFMTGTPKVCDCMPDGYRYGENPSVCCNGGSNWVCGGGCLSNGNTCGFSYPGTCCGSCTTIGIEGIGICGGCFPPGTHASGYLFSNGTGYVPPSQTCCSGNYTMEGDWYTCQ